MKGITILCKKERKYNGHNLIRERDWLKRMEGGSLRIRRPTGERVGGTESVSCKCSNYNNKNFK